VAIGPGAARDIDAIDYPLVKQPLQIQASGSPGRRAQQASPSRPSPQPWATMQPNDASGAPSSYSKPSARNKKPRADR
jgi:hypothetical protein